MEGKKNPPQEAICPGVVLLSGKTLMPPYYPFWALSRLPERYCLPLFSATLSETFSRTTPPSALLSGVSWEYDTVELISCGNNSGDICDLACMGNELPHLVGTPSYLPGLKITLKENCSWFGIAETLNEESRSGEAW